MFHSIKCLFQQETFGVVFLVSANTVDLILIGNRPSSFSVSLVLAYSLQRFSG